MPQKPLLKAGKKIEKKAKAANRHGKTPTTRKGKFEKPPKKPTLLAKFKEEREVTKMINSSNESMLAGKAEQAGGKLKAVKPENLPPVLQPKDVQKQRGLKGQANKAKASTDVEMA